MTKDRKEDGKKEEIKQKAIKLILKKGYDRMSMKDLGKAVGIQAPGLYHYFNGKKDILHQINEEGWQTFRETILDRAKEIDDPEERIKLYIRNMIKFEFELGEKTLILDDSVSIKNVGSRKVYEKEVFHFLRDTLKELSERKGVEKPIDPVIGAFSLFAMVSRVYAWYRPSGRISADELSNQITACFLRGFCGGAY
jgi:AcrR family transcriptional regulator